MPVEMQARKRTGQADEDTSVKLDAELWSKLQDHIPLHTVYEKLPYLDRLHLRVVCKEWNHRALQRLEPKPYFVTIIPSIEGIYLNGFIKYDIASKKLSFQCLPFPVYGVGWTKYLEPFEVEGLILCTHLNEWGVYNIHTRTWHEVTSAPGLSAALDDSFCGMMVDTSEKPYSFKLVLGITDKKTQIYDSRSKSWSPTSSSVLLSAREGQPYSCMCHNGCIYMTLGWEIPRIVVYSMEADSWTTLDNSPLRDVSRNTLGVWDGHIFTTTRDIGAQKVSVWELVDPKQQEWVEYACCTKDQYYELMASWSGLGSMFCEDYLLIFNWHEYLSDALVLFNMKTKKWEPARLPEGTLSGHLCEDDVHDHFEVDEVEWDEDADDDEALDHHEG